MVDMVDARCRELCLQTHVAEDSRILQFGVVNLGQDTYKRQSRADQNLDRTRWDPWLAGHAWGGVAFELGLSVEVTRG